MGRREQVDYQTRVYYLTSTKLFLIQLLAISGISAIFYFGYVFGSAMPTNEIGHLRDQAQMTQESLLTLAHSVESMREVREIESEIMVEEVGKAHQELARLRYKQRRVAQDVGVENMRKLRNEAEEHAQKLNKEFIESIGSNTSSTDWEEVLDRLMADRRNLEYELSMLEALLMNDENERLFSFNNRPVGPGWLSSTYGYRKDPFTGKKTWHNGIDWAAREGSDIFALSSGVVTYAGMRGNYGNTIRIEHPGGVSTQYSHAKSISVDKGDLIEKGDVIGEVGQTGRATGPHVHLEVHRGDQSLNPLAYFSDHKHIAFLDD